MQDKLELLKTYFGHTSFRSGQEEIIDTILNGRDVLGILPTGGGKSLCFQLPALAFEGLTIVISPLISLMQDQIIGLHQQGIPAAYLNSTLDEISYKQTLKSIYNGELKLLYVAPERLQQEGFIRAVKSGIVSMIAVDEAHCVSQWGHDFRESYRYIDDFIHSLDERPVVTAFSATATDRVQQDIVNQLNLENPGVYINSFDRPNLSLQVKNPSSKMKVVMDLINKDDSIIIYCLTRKNTEKVADQLIKKGFKAKAYHAGLSSKNREDIQHDFLFDRINIIVATNAFGMGIDKTDVRQVIHYNMPTDLEGYYQEAGRAGRDGLDSTATLLYSNQDILTAKFLLQNSKDETVLDRLQAMIGYTNHTECLRKYLLNYFNEDAPDYCGNCSACLGRFEKVNVTREGQMILSCVARMKVPFGMTMITQVLRGSNNEKIRQWKFDTLSTYGLMSSYKEQEIKNIISQLLALGYLNINEYKGLKLTKKAHSLLKNEANIYVKEEQFNKVVTDKANKKVRKEVDSANPELFDALRDLRYELASEERVPAYVIFSNSSLEDMVEQMPETYEDFLHIEGVGEVKAERYFEAFVEVLDEFR